MYLKLVTEIPSGNDLYCHIQKPDLWQDFITKATQEAKDVANEVGGGEWLLIVKVDEENEMFPCNIMMFCNDVDSDSPLPIYENYRITRFEEVDKAEFNEMTDDGKRDLFSLS